MKQSPKTYPFTFSDEIEARWTDSKLSNGRTRSSSRAETHRADTDERKEIIMFALLELWKQAPALRFGQLLSNSYDGPGSDLWGQGLDEVFQRKIYNIEDKDLVEMVSKFIGGLSMDDALR